MKDNRNKFCNEVNQFLYNRGYYSGYEYLEVDTTGYKTNSIFFYFDRIYKIDHPNNKVFILRPETVLQQYINWLVELIQPIMDKYNITKEQIV